MPNVEILNQKGYDFLWIDDYLWMWNLPYEVQIQKSIAKKAFGNVLVAGYGLGIIQEMLRETQKVKSVFTIEKYQEVTDACIEKYGIIYGDIGIEDFYDYVPSILFDCVIGDIWQEVTPNNLERYKKFKNKANYFINENGIILAWGQEYFEHLIEKDLK